MIGVETEELCTNVLELYEPVLSVSAHPELYEEGLLSLAAVTAEAFCESNHVCAH